MRAYNNTRWMVPGIESGDCKNFAKERIFELRSVDWVQLHRLRGMEGKKVGVK
jgi:hypothetical protein